MPKKMGISLTASVTLRLANEKSMRIAGSFCLDEIIANIAFWNPPSITSAVKTYTNHTRAAHICIA